MIRVVLSAVALCCLASASLAEYKETEGRVLARGVFDTMAEGSETIDLGSVIAFNDDAMPKMDLNKDGKVNFEEYMAFDPGFGAIAAKEGRSDGFQTALRVVFSFWDRNGNGELTTTEMKRALSVDFRRADLDDNKLLTQDEFLRGFSMMVAMRSAIRPDLTIPKD